MKDVEEAYKYLKDSGQNTVENLVQWMKDAKVLEMVKKTEDEVKLMFDDVEDKKNITLDKFKGVLGTMGFCSLKGANTVATVVGNATETVIETVSNAGSSVLAKMTGAGAPEPAAPAAKAPGKSGGGKKKKKK